jgi:hypothetical protein
LINVIPESESVLREALDLVALFARLFADHVHAAPDGRERHDHQRDDGECEQREFPVEHEHRHDRRQDGRDVRDDLYERARDDVVDVVDVARDAVHDFARLRIGEERDRHAVEMRDELRADVAHDAFAHERVEVALYDADQRGDCRGENHAAHVEPERADVVMRERDVDQMPGQQRRREPQCRRDEDADEHRNFLPPIRKKEHAEAAPIDTPLHFRLLRIEHRRPHQVGRRTA